METLSDATELKLTAADSRGATPGHGVRERWRKPVSLVAALALVSTLPFAHATLSAGMREWESYGGLVLVIAAILGRLWCAVYIGGRKNAELCMLGPYSLVRHPLYVFSSLGVFGVLIASHRPAIAVLGFVLFWVYYRSVMREEDSRLAHRFGQSYDVYAGRVYSVWPRFDAFNDVSTLVVTLQPLRRAFTEVVWFFVAWLVVGVVAS